MSFDRGGSLSSKMVVTILDVNFVFGFGDDLNPLHLGVLHASSGSDFSSAI